MSEKIKSEPRAPRGKPARKRTQDLSGLPDPTGLPAPAALPDRRPMTADRRQPTTDDRRPTTDDATGLPAPAALPEGWQVVRLEQVFDEVDKRVSEFGDTSAFEFPILSLTKNDGLVLQSERFEKRIATNDVTKYKVVRRGQIAYNPYVIWEGAIHILRRFDYGIVSPAYIVLQAKGGMADPYFLDFILRTPLAISAYNRFAAGAVNRRRAISKSSFLGIEVPLPPLPEQRAIARVLATLQRAVEAQDQLIAATRAFKRALMRHLFTYGAVPPADAARVPLKDTEIGAVPVGWEVVRLGEVCEKPQYGYTESATEKPIGPKFLRITDIQDGGVNWSTVPHCTISESLFEKYALKDGDIVVARIGATTGKSYFISNPPRSVFASYLIRVRAKATLLPEYLSYFAETENYWKQINESKGGRLKQGINIPILTSLRLQLPPLPEQRAIARILAAVDAKIAAEEKRKAALQTLFKTMLHQLMTGQIRVNAAG